MKMTKNYNEKELLLIIEGRMDTITSQELEKEINDELGNFESLTLDLNDLKYISSAGLRVLIVTQKKLDSDNIPFTIINVNGTVREIFEMSGFDKIFTIK
ncbi:STAS domain-containing protein [Methanobrevibacter sp.]|uniref:STAS domain-containing protein n=1 Tax=Methanobrevibacter sp. TaxID=66852 RepID=UPI00386FFAC4